LLPPFNNKEFFEKARRNMKNNHEGLPPSVALMQMMTGFWISSAIYVAAKLELADHIGDNFISVDDLALRVSAHPGSLYRLLRALASVGVSQRSNHDISH
jgi:predicted component of type VI protein secretion system